MPPNRQDIGNFVDLLRCPATQQPLTLDQESLRTPDGRHRYPILNNGIPTFAESPSSPASDQQRTHYDRIASAYGANLDYPHTIEYSTFLDTCLKRIVGDACLGVAAELCCGFGEAISLFGKLMKRGVGLDISPQMLSKARLQHLDPHICFVQGDATAIPIATASLDTVLMLGGIHHVPDRKRLFAEVSRILKPGGRFIFREPVSDFWPWRFLRSIVYRLSPTLDHLSERPLRIAETEPPLTAAGLRLEHWSTHGFVGFCVFMNSDVLIVNRLFRFIPGIRRITRMAARLDEVIASLPGAKGRGLQVIGRAIKLSPTASAKSQG